MEQYKTQCPLCYPADIDVYGLSSLGDSTQSFLRALSVTLEFFLLSHSPIHDIQKEPVISAMMPADDPAQLAPPTMRAWTHSQAGVPSTVLHFSSDVKTPALTSPTDVLVQITDASLSPAGSIMMQFCPFIFRSKPAIPELDFAGTLIAVGADVPKDRNLAP